MPAPRQARPDLDPAAEFDRTESTVLEVLIGSEGDSGLWSVAELGLEVGDELKAIDALEALHRAGLIHRTSDGFVFATRAAIRASELQL
jgi:hypothetical protein